MGFFNSFPYTNFHEMNLDWVLSKIKELEVLVNNLDESILQKAKEYTDEQLDQIEKFASIYLKISDMAVILDIPAEVLRWDISQRETDVSQRYYRGKAASKVKLLQQEMLLAQVGSPLAVENAHRNLLDMEDDE